MTACLRMATVGDVVAGAWWVLFFGGLGVLLRRQTVLRRRDASRQHQAAMRALARKHPSVTHPPR